MTRDEKIKAMQERNKLYDGIFYVAVRTTKIVCLPSCPAMPLAKNVDFYDTLDEALKAGYRPCKRCKPENPAACGEKKVNL